MISAKKAKNLNKLKEIKTLKQLDSHIKKFIKLGSLDCVFLVDGSFIKKNHLVLTKLGYEMRINNLTRNPIPLFFVESKNNYIITLSWFYADYL